MSPAPSRTVSRNPVSGAVLPAFLADLWRDRTRNRFRRFGQALVLAAEWPKGGEWLHAHFIHTPASVARYASTITGIALDLLGPRQGHLDVAGLGACRQARQHALDRDLHADGI